MKMPVRLLAPTLFSVIMASCATADRLNDVRIGMTKEQVVALLGKPDSMSAQGDIQYFSTI
jgi:outer membrane protein assembly factor BamE (lipoprotein component of BamABCDE complex)